jgi:hypothetical protein
MNSATPNSSNLVHRFHLILDRIVDLDQDEIERIEELVQVGEFGIALENLCTQLYEYDISVGEETAAAIASVGDTVSVEDRYWKLLRIEPDAE